MRDRWEEGDGCIYGGVLRIEWSFRYVDNSLKILLYRNEF